MASPLKEKPLHLPGQSLDEKLHEILHRNALIYAVIMSISLGFLSQVWLSYFLNTPENPLLSTILLIPLIIFSLYKLLKLRPEIIHTLQGREGERVVGQLLEELRAEGAHVFHDLIGDNFNIDHVIISSKGVFVIETKTWSKTDKNGKILYDGNQLLVNGIRPAKDPIEQSINESKWLTGLFHESTGKHFEVTPVLVFPGWFVEEESTKLVRSRGVLLLNPKAFVAFFKNMNDKLSNEDVSLVTFHLTRYMQSPY